jgi:hypothetical protein
MINSDQETTAKTPATSTGGYAALAAQWWMISVLWFFFFIRVLGSDSFHGISSGWKVR